MSLSLLLGCFWVLAATVVAFLPMRRQVPPGIVLLIAAPILLIFIGYEHGGLVAFAGTAAFVSMFRNPLRHLWRRARGEKLEIPK